MPTLTAHQAAARRNLLSRLTDDAARGVITWEEWARRVGEIEAGAASQ